MLSPKKVKYRKCHRDSLKGLSKGARTVAFGTYGLQAVGPSRLTARQIEALRVTLSRQMKKVGQYWLRVFPDRPITKKPAETRMGKGKGGVDHWVAIVKRGRVICEIEGLSEAESRRVLQLAAYKLPMKTKTVVKGHEHYVKNQ